jgi:hypothetical protein
MNLVSVEVVRADGSKSVVTGSVFGSVPHIVRVNDYVLSFKPEVNRYARTRTRLYCLASHLTACICVCGPTQGNYILTFCNDDKPGVISEVLQVLATSNVNVAR